MWGGCQLQRGGVQGMQGVLPVHAVLLYTNHLPTLVYDAHGCFIFCGLFAV